MFRPPWMLIVLLAVLCISPLAHADDKSKKFFPSPVPVNMKPIDYDETLFGVGYNITTLRSDWNDPFFQSGEQKIGEIEYTVHHLVVGKMKSTSNVSTAEYDLLVGKVESEGVTKQYYSTTINAPVNIEHSGSGYDIGARVVKSKSIKKQKRADGSTFIDWNYAYSLHIAYFSTDSTFRGTANPVTGLEVEAYTEEEDGLFLRPVIALQPIIRLGRNFSLVPYAAVGTKLTLSYYYWVDTEYVHFGSPQPGQLTEGEGFYSTFSGVEATIGFDIGIILSSEKKHGLTVGGAMSEIFGQDKSDFQEVHVLYTLPL